MNETANRYRIASAIADLIDARRVGYPSLMDEVATYTPDDWRYMAVEAGVSDGTYTPSKETTDYVLFLLEERAKNAADPFRGL